MSAAYVNPGATGDRPQPTIDHIVSAEQHTVEQRLVDNVVASFDACEDPRLKELMTSLVTHLHSFIRETRLTEAEWGSAIEFLTAAGHITDDVRQEFILLSDTLGLAFRTSRTRFSSPIPRRFRRP